ncbi:MAG TPA: Holliday junction resolvase RuvX [Balneolaceae bacterium]|nr:Holliday junction resolvase RuvX [Balneolaceae bacterium]
MAEYGRIIGIDVGTKWVGLARTDLLRTIANPIGTYHVDHVFDELEKLVKEENVQKLVVGWPLTPKGGEGRAIKMVERFLTKLRLHFSDIEIDKIDERYTSKEAVAAMVEAGVPKMKRRESDRVNRAAAAIILQKYLEQEG